MNAVIRITATEASIIYLIVLVGGICIGRYIRYQYAGMVLHVLKKFLANVLKLVYQYKQWSLTKLRNFGSRVSAIILHLRTNCIHNIRDFTNTVANIFRSQAINIATLPASACHYITTLPTWIHTVAVFIVATVLSFWIGLSLLQR